MFQSHRTQRIRRTTIKAALLSVLVPAFLLGAEAQAQSGQGMGNMQNMPGMSGGGTAATATTASATGTVESVNAPQRKIKLNHEPIPAINWPAMSMEFPAAPTVDLSKVSPGSKVRFTLSGSGSSYTVQSITPAQ